MASKTIFFVFLLFALSLVADISESRRIEEENLYEVFYVRVYDPYEVSTIDVENELSAVECYSNAAICAPTFECWDEDHSVVQDPSINCPNDKIDDVYCGVNRSINSCDNVPMHHWWYVQDLCMHWLNANVRPASSFDPMADAISFLTANDTAGHKRALINLFVSRSLSQRIEIKDAYKAIHNGNDFISNIGSDFDDDAQKVMKLLITPPLEYYADELHGSILNYDVDTIAEILTSLNNNGSRLLNNIYKQRYGESVGDTIIKCSYYRIDFYTFVLSVLTGSRNEDCKVNATEASQDADFFNRISTKTKSTIRHFTRTTFLFKSRKQLRLFSNKYKSMAGNIGFHTKLLGHFSEAAHISYTATSKKPKQEAFDSQLIGYD